jgi:hypothetical protein
MAEQDDQSALGWRPAQRPDEPHCEPTRAVRLLPWQTSRSKHRADTDKKKRQTLSVLFAGAGVVLTLLDKMNASATAPWTNRVKLLL